MTYGHGSGSLYIIVMDQNERTMGCSLLDFELLCPVLESNSSDGNGDFPHKSKLPDESAQT
jgi:hypothetical protein